MQEVREAAAKPAEPRVSAEDAGTQTGSAQSARCWAQSLSLGRGTGAPPKWRLLIHWSREQPAHWDSYQHL